MIFLCHCFMFHRCYSQSQYVIRFVTRCGKLREISYGYVVQVQSLHLDTLPRQLQQQAHVRGNWQAIHARHLTVVKVTAAFTVFNVVISHILSRKRYGGLMEMTFHRLKTHNLTETDDFITIIITKLQQAYRNSVVTIS